MKVLEEEKNEILDLIAALDRLQIAYDYQDLFSIENKERLIAIAVNKNRREAKRLEKLSKKR